MKKPFPLIFGLLLFIGLASCTPGGGDTTPDDSDSTTGEPTYTGDPDAEFTVNFDLNYPDAVGTPNAQIIKGGQLVAKPSDPIREDFTFLHWGEGMYGSVAWDFTKNIVTKNMTLYASWQYSYVEPEPGSKTFYVHAPEFWFDDNHVVALYAWDDDSGKINTSWPGEKMTHVEGQIYSHKVSEEYSKIIFARCTSSGGVPSEGSKTGDLPLEELTNPDFNYYWIEETIRYGDNACRGSWGVYPNKPEPPPAEPSHTYYVQIPTYWAEGGHVASIYMWGSSGENWVFPGEVMSRISDRIYSFEIPDRYINVIFSRATTSGARATPFAQTIDLIKPTDGRNYYIVDETEIFYDGSSDATKSRGEWSTYPG